MARPSTFNQETADELCARIADGESLRSVCKADDMPSVRTVLNWQSKHPEFAVQYAAAADARMQHIFDQMTEVAADGSRDWADKPDGKGGSIKTFDGEHVQRARLRIDTMKWQLSKMDPKKFGDKIEVDNQTQQNLTVTWQENSEMARLRRENPNLFMAKTISSWVSRIGMKLVRHDAVVLNPPAHIPESERRAYGQHLVGLGLLATPEDYIDLDVLTENK